MAVNPLDGLRRVAVDPRLLSTSMGEMKNQSPERVHTHGGRDHRRWVQSARGSTCGSTRASARASTCGSTRASTFGSVSGSAAASRILRNQHSPENAARERSRVRNLRQAFHSLQAALPSVPPDTKLSKLDVLVLATNYISYLSQTLDQGGRVQCERSGGFLHPVKKWPMRSLLYCGGVGELLSGVTAPPPSGREETLQLTPAAQNETDNQ